MRQLAYNLSCVKKIPLNQAKSIVKKQEIDARIIGDEWDNFIFNLFDDDQHRREFTHYLVDAGLYKNYVSAYTALAYRFRGCKLPSRDMINKQTLIMQTYRDFTRGYHAC